MRKKVWKIFWGFLGMMLLFTLLSRAVTGASMARVETERFSAGTIEHTVSETGRVEAGKSVAVCTESGQRVKEIYVQQGQSVKAGEVLFQLDVENLEEQILLAEQELEKLKLQNEDARNSQKLEQQKRELARNRAQEDYDQTVAQSDAAVAQAETDWEQAQQTLADFQAQEAADSSRENSTDEDTEKDSGGNSGKNAERETEQRAALEQAVSETKAAYEAAVQKRDEDVKAAARALEDAAAQTSADSSVRQNEITIAQQEQALQKLQKLQQEEGKVAAPVAGVVTELLIGTGDLTSEGAALRLADASGGCQLTLSVDRTQEEYVAKGSPVKLTPAGGKDTVSDYTVTNVTVNTENEELLDVVIELPEGALEPGTSVKVEITPASRNYQTILPLSALHQEQKGYYVLVLQERKGVLGDELTAARLEVEVLDKNNEKAAIQDGVLTQDQEIIISSSKVIAEGSRVRRQVQ